MDKFESRRRWERTSLPAYISRLAANVRCEASCWWRPGWWVPSSVTEGGRQRCLSEFSLLSFRLRYIIGTNWARVATEKACFSVKNWFAAQEIKRNVCHSLPARWTGGSVRYNLLSQHPLHHHPSAGSSAYSEPDLTEATNKPDVKNTQCCQQRHC